MNFSDLIASQKWGRIKSLLLAEASHTHVAEIIPLLEEQVTHNNTEAVAKLLMILNHYKISPYAPPYSSRICKAVFDLPLSEQRGMLDVIFSYPTLATWKNTSPYACLAWAMESSSDIFMDLASSVPPSPQRINALQTLVMYFINHSSADCGPEFRIFEYLCEQLQMKTDRKACSDLLAKAAGFNHQKIVEYLRPHCCLNMSLDFLSSQKSSWNPVLWDNAWDTLESLRSQELQSTLSQALNSSSQFPTPPPRARKI